MEEASMSGSATKIVEVDIPMKASQGTHYHAPGSPCGSHLTKTYQFARDDLVKNWQLEPCTACVRYHGLEEYDV